MTADIAIHGFETSNNIKVRVALGYKGLAYTFHTIDPAERDEIVRLSGQHLTPVMVHGDTVLFDSAAIQRYLDANFPDTPRLFGASRDEQWEIEDHELFARVLLAGPMMEIVHTRVSGGSIDDATRTRCDEAFAAAVDTLAGRMAGREWMVGDSLSAADIAAAAVLRRVATGGMLTMPASAETLEGWVERVLAFDGPGRSDGAST